MCFKIVSRDETTLNPHLTEYFLGVIGEMYGLAQCNGMLAPSGPKVPR